ncbi:uncharacterized protein [Macrobrachium rosenbergii]|uniref:uncharacterized protein isoform X3 n=1 Tax=Macrobrachium rosenbergii TaxID=79674 RepID=UPI0034D3BF26
MTKMPRPFFLALFVSPLLLRDVLGREKSRPDNDGLCDVDVTVGSEEKVIKEFKQEAFQIYCKFHEGFQSLELKVEGYRRVDKTLNFTVGYFNSTSDSLWQLLDVKIDYEYQYFNWAWLLTVSIDQKNVVKKSYIDWGLVGEYLKSVKVTAYGQSEWRFTEPGGNCTSQNPGGTSSGGNSILWILVVGAFAIMATPGIAVLVHRIKYKRAAVPPQANPGAGSSGSVQTENAIYGYRRY